MIKTIARDTHALSTLAPRPASDSLSTDSLSTTAAMAPGGARSSATAGSFRRRQADREALHARQSSTTKSRAACSSSSGRPTAKITPQTVAIERKAPTRALPCGRAAQTTTAVSANSSRNVTSGKRFFSTRPIWPHHCRCRGFDEGGDDGLAFGSYDPSASPRAAEPPRLAGSDARSSSDTLRAFELARWRGELSISAAAARVRSTRGRPRAPAHMNTNLLESVNSNLLPDRSLTVLV